MAFSIRKGQMEKVFSSLGGLLIIVAFLKACFSLKKTKPLRDNVGNN